MVLLLQLSRFIDNGDAALFPEWRIGQNQAIPFTRIIGQAVQSGLNGARLAPDAVQVKIHDTKPSRGGNDIHPLYEGLPQMPLLVRVQTLTMFTDHIVMGLQQKSPRAAGGVKYSIFGRRPHDLYDGLYQLTGSEILPGSFGRFRRAFSQQTLINIPLNISLHG